MKPTSTINLPHGKENRNALSLQWHIPAERSQKARRRGANVSLSAKYYEKWATFSKI